jgi:hypothetical protein
MSVENRSKPDEILYATEGTGPLLERDYFAAFEGATCAPEQVAGMVRSRFERFAPAETARFERAEDHRRLEPGDALDIRIALMGRCRVRVVHCDDRSLTLRTLRGHPEAGRITFGAGRDRSGRLTFRIRSRTRASGPVNYLGFLFLGKQMQARCWIRFVDRVVRACGGRLAGPIRVRTWRVAEEPGDRPGHDEPTFRPGDEEA